MITGPIVGDDIAFRLSADIGRDRPASRIAPVMRGADPNVDKQSLIRLKLLARPAFLPASEFTLGLVHTTSRAPQIVGLSPPFRARRNPDPDYGIFGTRVDAATLAAVVPVLPLLRSTTTVSATRSRFRRFAIPGLGEALTHIRETSAETLLAWTPTDAVRVSGGVNRLTTRLEQRIDISLISGIGRFTDRQRSLGLFGEVEWRPLPPLTVIAGLRRQRDTQRRHGSITRPVGPATLDFRGDFSAWLPKLSLAWHANEALTAGVLV